MIETACGILAVLTLAVPAYTHRLPAPEPEPVSETYADEDIDLVAKIVWLEGRGESAECRRAITETIYNRLRSEIWGDTIQDVIYAKQNGRYEYSTVYLLDTAEVDEDIREIVVDVFENGSEIDENIMYFRADYYHPWAEDEFCIDNTYFSSNPLH